MNATIHAELSVKRRGGIIEDYYNLHDFMDCSKEVEATNKHRFLTHTMFFVKEVMIPIFGNTIHIKGGKPVNMKDMLEQDHIVADYGGKFIPTLTDFADEIEDHVDDESLIKDFQSDNAAFFQEHTEVHRTMMTPLHLTGKIKGLFATHNSWFVGTILPRIYPHIKMEIKNYNINCAYFFNRMNYKPWMQNGKGVPPSYERLEKSKTSRRISLPTPSYDGNVVQQNSNVDVSPISQSIVGDFNAPLGISAAITDGSPSYFARMAEINKSVKNDFGD